MSFAPPGERFKAADLLKAAKDEGLGEHKIREALGAFVEKDPPVIMRHHGGNQGVSYEIIPEPEPVEVSFEEVFKD